MAEKEYGDITLQLISDLRKRGIKTISVAMRHSARYYDSEVVENEPFLGLTDQGKDLSFRLGISLPAGLDVRLFSSAVGRCIETAYLIDKGYTSVGESATRNELEKFLSPFYVRKPFEIFKSFKDMQPDFIRFWFSGNISSESIDTSETAAKQIAQILIEKLDGKPENCVNISVTHDWSIYLLKEYYLGLKHEEFGKVEYLEGLAFYKENGKVYVVNHQSDPKELNID